MRFGPATTTQICDTAVVVVPLVRVELRVLVLGVERVFLCESAEVGLPTAENKHFYLFLVVMFRFAVLASRGKHLYKQHHMFASASQNAPVNLASSIPQQAVPEFWKVLVLW